MGTTIDKRDLLIERVSALFGLYHPEDRAHIARAVIAETLEAMMEAAIKDDGMTYDARQFVSDYASAHNLTLKKEG